MNIVLVGFMGTGKSSVGKLLAEKLGRPFVDMDSLIEDRAGKSIPRIFQEDGEPRFRDMERSLVKELALKKELVIAAGGGVVLNSGNISDFAKTGLVVCLFASENELVRRLAASRNRPLLQTGDMADRIASLFKARKPLYDAIPCGIDTTGLTVGEVAERILHLFKMEDA